jgi:carboxyl-terminal processing protease
VQTILPLTSNTAIKLTTARYFTPLGRSIQAKGIAPDFWVEETAEGAVVDRLRMRESDLNRHLSGTEEAGKGATEKTKAGPVRQEAKNGPAASEPRDFKPIEFGSESDYQLQQALNHLKGKPVVTSAKPENG